MEALFQNLIPSIIKHSYLPVSSSKPKDENGCVYVGVLIISKIRKLFILLT